MEISSQYHHDPVSRCRGYLRVKLPFQLPYPYAGSPLARCWRTTFGLHVEFDPNSFPVLFIPPLLLFADGWKTPTREF